MIARLDEIIKELKLLNHNLRDIAHSLNDIARETKNR